MPEAFCTQPHALHSRFVTGSKRPTVKHKESTVRTLLLGQTSPTAKSPTHLQQRRGPCPLADLCAEAGIGQETSGTIRCHQSIASSPNSHHLTHNVTSRQPRLDGAACRGELLRCVAAPSKPVVQVDDARGEDGEEDAERRHDDPAQRLGQGGGALEEGALSFLELGPTKVVHPVCARQPLKRMLVHMLAHGLAAAILNTQAKHVVHMATGCTDG